MASDVVHKFIIAVNNSPELRAKTQKAIDGSNDPSGFVAVAKTAGYEFSLEDAKTYFNNVLSSTKRPGEFKGELTDEDLDLVSGGKDTSPASRSSALTTTVKMFQGMSFTALPSWTGFRV
jgi:predicted ribosomally synthesized peptide with nif11-like leader